MPGLARSVHLLIALYLHRIVYALVLATTYFGARLNGHLPDGSPVLECVLQRHLQ